MKTWKIVLMIAFLLTYTIVYVMAFGNDRQMFIVLLPSFIVSFIVSDILVRSILELLRDKLPGKVDRLEEGHIAQLFETALAKEITVLDVYHKNFYISIRTLDKAPNGLYRIDFFALSTENYFDENAPTEYIQFIGDLKFKEFRKLFWNAYDKIVKQGKEYYNDRTQ